jgi:hypothetical protein
LPVQQWCSGGKEKGFVLRLCYTEGKWCNMAWVDWIKDLAAVPALREQMALVRAKLENAESEYNELKGEVARLQKLEKVWIIRDSVEYAHSVYWKPGAALIGDPFCPRCQDADEKLIHMHKRGDMARGEQYWECLKCKAMVLLPNQPKPPAPQAPSAV